eukprot:6292971-Amphidinium_carterae.1
MPSNTEGSCQLKQETALGVDGANQCSCEGVYVRPSIAELPAKRHHDNRHADRLEGSRAEGHAIVQSARERQQQGRACAKPGDKHERC